MSALISPHGGYRIEEFRPDSQLGRESDREVVLTRALRHTLRTKIKN